MILFINVFLADQGSGMTYDRGLLPDSDRADIFKYSLASFSVIPWSSVFIYWDAHDTYRPRRQEVDAYIRSLFPDAAVYPFRLDHQSQWKLALKSVLDAADPLVWFCCNHDHIFVDYELDLLTRIERKLQEMETSHPHVSGYFSHWPELLYLARDPNADSRSNGQILEQHDDYSVFGFRSNDSVQIVNKNVLRYWWYEHDYGDAWVPRSDPLGARCKGVDTPELRCVVPHRELVRHFDGYSHNRVDINDCPPLTIPSGFFEDAIRILYCADRPEPGFVSVNPLKRNYSTTDPKGADMKCVLDDLPLFWHSRIKETRIVQEAPLTTLLRHRNQAVLQAAWGRISIPVQELTTALRFEDQQGRDREIRRLETWRRMRDLRRGPGKLLRASVRYIKKTVMTMIGQETSERFHQWRVRRRERQAL